MNFGFNFMLICETARRDEGPVVLENIFNTVNVADDRMPFDLKCTAVIGCVLVPEMHGKRLDLMAWKLDERGHRVAMPGWVGTHVTLPEFQGADVLSYSISIPVLTSGYYGFDLFDRDGAFGPAFDPNKKGEQKLATYLFGIFTESSKGPMHLR